MPFQIKSMRDILGDMVTWIQTNNSKLTNFRVGGVARTLLEAFAMEIESLYYQAKRGFDDAIENSVFNSFNFTRQPAIASSGTITISFKSPLTQGIYISTGDEFFTIPVNGEIIYFSCTQDTVASVGATSVDIPVQCEQTGTIGNVPPYSIRRAVSPMPVVSDIFNTAEFINGAPEETREARKKRFSDFIDSLARGTTAAIRYGCSQVSGVVGVNVVEQVGMVTVYAHDSNGALPDTLKSNVQTQLDAYRCGGIPAQVLPVVLDNVDLNLTVTLNPGYDSSKYSQIIHDSVVSFLNSFTVGKTLYRADLIRFVMGIDQGAILNVDTGLTEDIDSGSGQLIRPGTINVTIQ